MAATANNPGTDKGWPQLDWLELFDSDLGRIFGLLIVFVGIGLVRTGPTLVRAFFADRRDKRRFELERMALRHDIDREKQRRIDERLDFDGD